MANKDEFEEEMRKADAAAYRASLSDEPGTESTRDFMKRTGTKANRPKATVGGSKIVTKEQMKKAGFDNLRDYMNAQKGLKRRDGKAPSKAEPTKSAAKIEKPGFFRRAVAALGGVKLPQSDYGSEPEEDKKPTTRPKPYSTAAAIASKNAGFKKGGSVSSASKRADGCAKKGKTRGRMV